MSIDKIVLIVSRKKNSIARKTKAMLEKDMPIMLVDPGRKTKVKNGADFILLPCQFQCALADCLAMFKFVLRHQDIPFLLIRFLPIKKAILPGAAFSLSLFKPFELSTQQKQVIDFLTSSDSYSRNLISRLPHRRALARVLTIQTDVIDNPSIPFSLKRAAQIAELSSCWLSRKFKEISGMGLRDFLTKNRLCLGLWRLASSDDLIKTIAIELSYKPLSFSESFSREFSISPRDLRRYLMTS